MDSRMVLFFLSTIAGFVMIVGGMWLIYKEKIYIDRESQQPIKIELPGHFSFTSNYPALALFVLGFFPLIYPFQKLTLLTQYKLVKDVHIRGLIHSDGVHDVVQPDVATIVYAARLPAYPLVRSGEEFTLGVPVIDGTDEYEVMLVVNGHVLDYQKASAKENNGDIKVEFKPLMLEPAEYAGKIDPVPPDYR